MVAMPYVHINVLFPRDRDRTGVVRVEQDGRVVAEFAALGRGSRGRGETSFVNDGNAPTGIYEAAGLETTSDRNQNSYGLWGAVRLRLVGGNALLAERIGHRSGLLIHGGSLCAAGYWRGEGALRTTHRCVRISNEDMKSLKQILEKSSMGEYSRVSPLVTVSVEES
jgi:hypothetical protein